VDSTSYVVSPSGAARKNDYEEAWRFRCGVPFEVRVADPCVAVKEVDGDVKRGFCLPRLVPRKVVVHRVVGEGRGDP